MNTLKLLVVDDEPDIRLELQDFVAYQGCDGTLPLTVTGRLRPSKSSRPALFSQSPRSVVRARILDTQLLQDRTLA